MLAPTFTHFLVVCSVSSYLSRIGLRYLMVMILESYRICPDKNLGGALSPKNLTTYKMLVLFLDPDILISHPVPQESYLDVNNFLSPQVNYVIATDGVSQ